MPVIAVALVFRKIGRIFYLADVVVVGHNPRQQRIATDRFRRRFHQRPHDDAMVVRTGRLDNEIFEQGVVQVGKLQQFYVGGVAEQNLDQRRDPVTTMAAKDPA